MDNFIQNNTIKRPIIALLGIQQHRNQATIRRSLNAEYARRLKPHQVCTGTYVKAVVEATMKGYNLAVRPPRIALTLNATKLDWTSSALILFTCLPGTLWVFLLSIIRLLLHEK